MTPSSLNGEIMVSPVSPLRNTRILIVLGAFVLAWFALGEIASHIWYSTHESKLEKNPVPAAGEDILEKIRQYVRENGEGASERDIGSAATEMLKCSYGKTLSWRTIFGGMSAATVLKWDERSLVGGVETFHNPGTCLRAAGWQVGDSTSLGIKNYCGVTCEVTKWKVSQGGFNMLAYSGVFRRYLESGDQKSLPGFWNDIRLRSVLSGRRDAPVLILLAYLPDTEEHTDSRFNRLMKAIFCAH